MASIKTYSYSQINTYKSCPEKYKLSYIDRLRKPDEGIEAFMGNRVHEVLEWVFKERANKFTTFDKLTAKYDDLWLNAWHDRIFIADPRVNTDHIYTIGLRCLGNFCTNYGPIFETPVYATELKLEFEIEGYKFRGVLDRVDKTIDGKWIITDYKTSKRAKGIRAAKSDIQLGLYYIAVQQNFPEANQILTGWNFLRHNKEIHLHPEEESIQKIKNQVVRRIKKIEKNISEGYSFFPKESILCHWCYYWDECSAKTISNPARSAR
jgi:RecB family exonuclease|tara:strand:+ start:674 stop:1468 length:795 start_codon:yes stop_codon:yes gene_type:complete